MIFCVNILNFALCFLINSRGRKTRNLALLVAGFSSRVNFFKDKWHNGNIIWIMHGVAGNSRKYWPMWRHCSPRVKTEYVLLPEAKPRAIMLMSSSPEGYSDVTEVNIFLLLASYCMHYSFYHMASLTACIYKNHFIFLFLMTVVSDLITRATYYCPLSWRHGCKCISRVLPIRRSPVNSQKCHIPSLYRSHVIITHIFIQRASQRLLQQAACPSTRRKVLKSHYLANSQLACQDQWGAALRVFLPSERFKKVLTDAYFHVKITHCLFPF